MSDKRSYASEDILGAVLLIVALFALGLFNFKSDEPLVEAGLRAQSQAIVKDSVHGLKVVVEGRDLTLSGLADSAEEKTEVLSQLRKLEGRGRLRSADVHVLEPAEPFLIRAELPAKDAALIFSGVVPTERLRAELREDFGDGVSALVLASGMPDDDWPDVLHNSLRALLEMERGVLQITERDILVSGQSLTPTTLERAILLLTDLPEKYVFSTDVKVLDDGTALRLNATRNNGALSSLAAKLPETMAGANIEGDLTFSPLQAPFEKWDEAIDISLQALSQLQNGHLAIIGNNLTLTGDAWSETAYRNAAQILENLPREMTVSQQIALADSGSPFGLRMIKQEASVVAEGKVPQSLAPRVLAALADAELDANGLEVAKVSPGDLWWQGASLGAEAMRYLEQGEIEFIDLNLAVSGWVQDPEGEKALRSHLTNLPEEIAVTTNIKLIDDGTPQRVRFDYNGKTVVLSGKLPDYLNAQEITATFEVPLTEGEILTTPKPAQVNWTEAISVASQALALSQRGILRIRGTEVSMEAILLNPAREREVLDILSNLPAGYSLETKLSFQDDGRPFAFRLEYDGARGTLSGKVPLDLGPASQAAILGAPISGDAIEFARIPADADWWVAARAGLKALAPLSQGILTLDAHQMSLNGKARSQRDIDAARVRLAPFSEDFKIEIDLSLTD